MIIALTILPLLSSLYMNTLLGNVSVFKMFSVSLDALYFAPLSEIFRTTWLGTTSSPIHQRKIAISVIAA